MKIPSAFVTCLPCHPPPLLFLAKRWQQGGSRNPWQGCCLRKPEATTLAWLPTTWTPTGTMHAAATGARPHLEHDCPTALAKASGCHISMVCPWHISRSSRVEGTQMAGHPLRASGPSPLCDQARVLRPAAHVSTQRSVPARVPSTVVFCHAEWSLLFLL